MVSHRFGEPVEQWYKIAARAGKLMRAEMMSFAVVSETLCPYAQLSWSHEKLTGSGSEMDVPLTTAKNSAWQRPRLSPLKASGSRRLAGGTTANPSLRARWQ